MEFGKKVYYCKKVVGKNDTFEAPIEITLRPNDFSLMPTRGYTDIEIYGKDAVNIYTAYAKKIKWGTTLFTQGSRFYVDGNAPSQDEENYGDKANAEVDAVLDDNKFLKLMIKKLVA